MDHAIRAVLYDLDGTLADTTELVMHCFRRSMREHLGEVPSEEEWLRGFGRPLEVQMARFARSREQQEALVRSYRAIQEEEAERLVRPFPGAAETVAELARRGVALAIVTSRHRESTVRAMHLCGLTRHFPVIVTPEDVVNPKPHPEPVEAALRELGVRPGEALFVGDSPHDVAAGRAAGTRTAGALWGPFPRAALEAAGPDHLLAAQSDVLEHLGRAG